MKKYYPIMFVGSVLGVIVFICFFLMFSGQVSLSNNGFAVDSEGQLYVGQQNEIIVLKDGECVNAINPRTSRSYAFTITDEQAILLSTSSTVYTMDLSGNVLTEQPDEGTKVYNQLQHKKSFTDVHGAKYTMRSPWGRTSVYKDGVRIYEIPTLDYIVRILLIVSVVGGLVASAITAYLRFSKQTTYDGVTIEKE